MPSPISNADFQFGRFISENPSSGIIAAIISGSAVNVLTHNPATGTMTLHVPPGTSGGNSLLSLDAELSLTKEQVLISSRHGGTGEYKEILIETGVASALGVLTLGVEGSVSGEILVDTSAYCSVIRAEAGLALSGGGGGFTTHALLAGTGVLSLFAGFVQKQFAPTETVLVSGVNARLGNSAVVTLTASRIVGALLNPSIGQRFTFTFVQDGTGGRAVTLNPVFKIIWSDTGNTANKRSSVSCIYDGTNWNQDGAQTPYV